MTRVEFAKAAAYIAVGCGKALPVESQEVYFDLLGDLPFDVLMVSAKRVLLEHRWANFPSIAELREAAAETIRGTVKELSAGEAWELAWRLVGNTDPEVAGSFERAAHGVPAIVVNAIKAYGLQAMCYGGEPVGVVRGQFLKIYEQLAARDKRLSLFPASTKAAIEGIGKRQLPTKVTTAIAQIGAGGT